MGKVVRAKDWSQTPLGPISSWAARSVHGGKFGAELEFSHRAGRGGGHHIQLYNDGYWPICGVKHPARDGPGIFSECWASAFPVIGDAFSQRAGRHHPPSSKTSGCFWTASGIWKKHSSPFRSAPSGTSGGAVVGLFHPVTETTGKMVGQAPPRETLSRFDRHRPRRAISSTNPCAASAQILEDARLRRAVLSFFLPHRRGSPQPPRLIAQSGPGSGAGRREPVGGETSRGDQGRMAAGPGRRRGRRRKP